jgi:hypothetical protein
MERIDSQIQLFLEMTNLPEHSVVFVAVDAMLIVPFCLQKNLIPHLLFSFNHWIADTAACLYMLCDMSYGRPLRMFRLRLPRFAKLSGGTKLSLNINARMVTRDITKLTENFSTIGVPC